MRPLWNSIAALAPAAASPFDSSAHGAAPVKPIRVVIADDHPLIRAGLIRWLTPETGFEVVGEAATAEEAVAAVNATRPDVLLLDVVMPGGSAFDALRSLKDCGGLQIILLTAAIESRDIVRALQLGAHGVLLKDSRPDALRKAVRAVMAGEYWVARNIVGDLVHMLGDANVSRVASAARYQLTAREREIVECVVEGRTNRDIADKLCITEDTVKHHLTNIFDKTGASNRLELALFTIDHRLTTPR
jgi:DNA-binding NarL/FixJ family response regulator